MWDLEEERTSSEYDEEKPKGGYVVSVTVEFNGISTAQSFMSEFIEDSAEETGEKIQQMLAEVKKEFEEEA